VKSQVSIEINTLVYPLKKPSKTTVSSPPLPHPVNEGLQTQNNNNNNVPPSDLSKKITKLKKFVQQSDSVPLPLTHD
jgi:hypothetical protein